MKNNLRVVLSAWVIEPLFDKRSPSPLNPVYRTRLGDEM